MPKGRGSNKKGRGPTQGRPQTVDMGQLQVMVMQGQIEDLVMQKRSLEGQLHQARSVAMGILLTKQGKTATITPAHKEKLQDYAGLNLDDGDDGSLIVSLVEKPPLPEVDGDESA